MVDRIIIFYGSRRDFEEIVEQETEDFEEVIPFMELIQHYNARLRPNESGVGEDGLYHRIDVEACVVRADDYASVLEHRVIYAKAMNKAPIKAIKKRLQACLQVSFFRLGSGHFTNARERTTKS